jgi:signal peptidase II
LPTCRYYQNIVKRAALIIVLVLLVDQALKVWLKLNFYLGESVPLFGEGCQWAYLQFVENRGMAFGLEFGGPLGKLSLTLFRIIAVIGIGWLLVHAVKRERGAWLMTSLALIFAGALGNIIDSAFYGVLFSESLPFQKAVFLPPDGGYAPLLHGAVVDMLYFPLWECRFPEWLPIWGGERFEFFRPVFNIADAAISVGVVLLLFSQRKSKEVPAPLPSEQVTGTGATITEVVPPPAGPTVPEEVTGSDPREGPRES